MWRAQPDIEPKPRAQGAVVAVAAVVALGLLTLGLSELYVSGLAPSEPELEWLKSQRATEHESLPSLSDADAVTLNRSQCFGSCPAYEVSIRGSGQIEFKGGAFVCRRHVTATLADLAALARLVRGLELVRFGSMPNYEDRDATDQETVTITLLRDGRAHTVRHYYGDTKAPSVLTLIEQRIDKLAGTAGWTGTPADGNVNCTLPDGRRQPVAREIPDENP